MGDVGRLEGAIAKEIPLGVLCKTLKRRRTAGCRADQAL